MEKNPFNSLTLNFTPNTLDSNGLKSIIPVGIKNPFAVRTA